MKRLKRISINKMKESRRENKLTITQLTEEERPREKMMKHGASALTVPELLAILIGTGTVSENAVELMTRIYNDCNGKLRRIGRMTVDELCNYNGVGPAKAITILAACEIGYRRSKEIPDKSQKMNDPNLIYSYFRELERLDHEQMHIMFLNHQLELISTSLVSKGGTSCTNVDVKLILREALLKKASSMVLCHNHPSGSSLPSRQDDLLTKKIQEAATLMDIRLIDHIIIGDNDYYSYNSENKL